MEGLNAAEIRVYEDIGFFGVSAKQFADDLEGIEAETIHVRLNTEGGEVFDGIAMHNALKAHPAKIIVHVDGIAASAGSIVAMAGDEIRMADNAFLMIHEARGGVMGEADDMRHYADTLDKLNDSIAITYQGRAGKSRKYWRAKMADESWFTAEEAKSEGLADAIEQRNEAAKNRFDFRIYNHVKKIPDAVRAAWGQPQQPAPEQSPRGDTAPVVLTQEVRTMSETTQAAPASTPAATSPAPNPQQGNTASPIVTKSTMESLRETEIQGYRDQGYREGEQTGRVAERERLRAITDACPGKPQMALNAFLAGQTPDAVKLAFDASAQADQEWQQRFEQERISNARQVALAAAGGHPGVAVALVGDEDAYDGPVSADEAKEKAIAEWDHQPKVRKGFSSKENYVAFRKRDLMDRTRVAR